MPNPAQCIICGEKSTRMFQIRSVESNTPFNLSTIGACDEHVARLVIDHPEESHMRHAGSDKSA